MGRKIFPWTDIDIEEIEYETDYRWDCIDTEITELPDVLSWCEEGDFRVLGRIVFNTSSNIIQHLSRDFDSTANIASAINTPSI